MAGIDLPENCVGAALFADLAGFTALTEALAQQLGLASGRGAHATPQPCVRLMIATVHRYGGSVVDFSGDAVMCWFDDTRPDGGASGTHRAATCALELQDAAAGVAPWDSPTGAGDAVAEGGGSSRPCVACCRRDPAVRVVDVLAGTTITRLRPRAGGDSARS